MAQQNRQPVRGTSLEQRMNQSGGIQPNAHPEYGAETPMESVQKQVKSAIGAVRKFKARLSQKRKKA